jgi:hypothetical protein
MKVDVEKVLWYCTDTSSKPPTIQCGLIVSREIIVDPLYCSLVPPHIHHHYYWLGADYSKLLVALFSSIVVHTSKTSIYQFVYINSLSIANFRFQAGVH